MAPLLPVLVFIALCLVCLGWVREESQAQGFRIAALQSILLVGAGVAIASEALSLVHGLSRSGAALTWGLVLVSVAAVGVRTSALKRGANRLVNSFQRLDWTERLFLAGMGVLLGLLLVVAVNAPASTSDSLQYHLARVVHWAQNGSLNHYMTGFRPQLSNPIWAEEAILHLRLLKGEDTLAGLVQWAAFVGVLLAVTQIAAQLGASRRYQLAAAAFAFSLPMGLMQATSTQNDMVAALWLCCTAVFVLRAAVRPPTTADSIFLGLAAGLGLLTKGTFYPFVVPFGIAYLVSVGKWTWAAARAGKQNGGSAAAFPSLKYISSAAIAGLLAAALNLGFWLRNIISFGGPLGSREWVGTMTAGRYDPGAFIVSLIRNVVVNFATPSPVKNEQIEHFLIDHLAMLDPRIEEFVLRWGWNLEHQAGNPVHLLLAAVAMAALATAALLLAARRQPHRPWSGYLLAVGGVIAMLAWIIPPDRWGVRYQVPVFMVCAPLVGLALELAAQKANPLPRRGFPTAVLVSMAFLIISLPWVFFNRTRPLIALKEAREPFSIPLYDLFGFTLGSVLFEPPEGLLFAFWPDYRQPYLQLSDEIRKSGCTEVGLRIDSGDPEYLFWWLLDAPQSGIRIESIYSFPELQRYADPGFKPCAVLCTICGDRTRVHGLPRVGLYSNAGLFIGPGFLPDPDG